MKPGGFPPQLMLSEHAEKDSRGDGAIARSGDHHSSGARHFGSTGKS
jgi:hypothetical protein